MRKKTALAILIVLAFSLIGTGLSALREQSEFISYGGGLGTLKVAYGFPLNWIGYSEAQVFAPIFNKIYWFSLESFLMDTGFWLAVSFTAYIVAMELVRYKTRALRF